MPVEKPNFVRPSVSALGRNAGEIESLLLRLRKEDGVIDVQALRNAAVTSGRSELLHAVDIIEDQFSRTENRPTSPMAETQARAAPTHLSAEEVITVIDAVRRARDDLAGADLNEDSFLGRDEIAEARNLPGLAGALMQAVIDESLKTYRVDLDRWAHALIGTSVTVEQRVQLDRQIEALANHHAETPAGAEAIKWAFREIVAAAPDTTPSNLKARLERAEQSIVSYVGMIGLAKRAGSMRGHLSDDEIRKMLRAPNADLTELAERKREIVEDRLCMSYADYLEGKDLRFDERHDPDFEPYRHLLATEHEARPAVGVGFNGFDDMKDGGDLVKVDSVLEKNPYHKGVPGLRSISAAEVRLDQNEHVPVVDLSLDVEPDYVLKRVEATGIQFMPGAQIRVELEKSPGAEGGKFARSVRLLPLRGKEGKLSVAITDSMAASIMDLSFRAGYRLHDG